MHASASTAPCHPRTQVKPALRGTLHQHAIFAALAAGALLVASAATPEARVSCAIYVASLVALFTASAVYHRFDWSPTTRVLLRHVDHASIFVLIAGRPPPCQWDCLSLDSQPCMLAMHAKCSRPQ